MLLEGRDLCDFSHQPLYSLSSYFLEKSHLEERKVKMIQQLIVLLLPFRCVDLKGHFSQGRVCTAAPVLQPGSRVVCLSTRGGESPELQPCALTAPGAPACPELACPASGEMKRKKRSWANYSPQTLSLRFKMSEGQPWASYLNDSSIPAALQELLMFVLCLCNNQE